MLTDGFENLSLMECRSNLDEWPEGRIINGEKVWHHSDIKNLAYFYVYKFYDEIIGGVK